jgi:Flp pilus assembly protein TadD
MLRPLVPDLADTNSPRDLDLPAIRVALAAASTLQAAAIWLLQSSRAEAVFVHQPWLGRIRASFGRRRGARTAQVISAAWRLLDGFIGRMVEAAGPEAQVLLVSPGWTSLPGVVLAAGPGATSDPAFPGAGILDIAPTLLGRFGLSVPGLPGHPISIAAPAGPMRPGPDPAPAPRRRPEARTMYVAREAGYAPAPRATRHWRANGLADLAWMTLERDPSVAREIAGAALRLNPKCILALRVQVRARVMLEETEGLEALGLALLEAAPGRPWGALALGAWHVLRGKTPQAAPWLEKVEADPDPTNLMTLAAVWLTANRPANATRVFRRILALDPLNVSAEIGVAMAAVAQRDYDAAERALQRALNQDPGRPAIHLQLARIYAKTGRSLQARQSAATAVNLGAPRSQAGVAQRGRTGL